MYSDNFTTESNASLHKPNIYVSMIVMNEKKNTMISIIVSQLLNCPILQIKHRLPVNL